MDEFCIPSQKAALVSQMRVGILGVATRKQEKTAVGGAGLCASSFSRAPAPVVGLALIHPREADSKLSSCKSRQLQAPDLNLRQQFECT